MQIYLKSGRVFVSIVRFIAFRRVGLKQGNLWLTNIYWRSFYPFSTGWSHSPSQAWRTRLRFRAAWRKWILRKWFLEDTDITPLKK